LIAPFPFGKPHSRRPRKNRNSVNAGQWSTPQNRLTVAGGNYLSPYLRAWYAVDLSISLTTGLPLISRGSLVYPVMDRVGIISETLCEPALADAIRRLSTDRRADVSGRLVRYSGSWDLAHPAAVDDLVYLAIQNHLRALVIETRGSQAPASAESVDRLLSFRMASYGCDLFWVTGALQDIEVSLIHKASREGRASLFGWSRPAEPEATWTLKDYGRCRSFGVSVQRSDTGHPISTVVPADAWTDDRTPNAATWQMPPLVTGGQA